MRQDGDAPFLGEGLPSSRGPRPILTVRTAFVNLYKPTGESPGLRGHRWSLANRVAGVNAASESVWGWGPVQGRTSSSLQASATPRSGLSDFRTEESREVEGTGENKLGI